tara:strand:+ start:103669 stop:103929 length:261 start_codon:yes stop_codon:yes gene_type:complete
MKMEDYRYAPHSEETKVLCARLEETLPNVTFKFVVEHDGLLRMRAFALQPEYMDREMLLRHQTPDQVVEAFVNFFEPKPEAAVTAN